MKKLFSRALLFCLLALTALPARMQAADPVTLVDLTAYSAVQYLNQCTWLSDIEGGRTSRPWSMTYGYPMYLQLNDMYSSEYDEYLVTPDIELQPGHQYVLTLQPSMYSQYLEKPGRRDPRGRRPLDHGKFFNFDPQGILADGVIFISANYFLEALILRTLSPVSSI